MVIIIPIIATDFDSTEFKVPHTASEELKLTIAGQTMQQNGILTVADEIRQRDRAENMGKRIAALREKLEDCKMTYDVYVDIAST